MGAALTDRQYEIFGEIMRMAILKESGATEAEIQAAYEAYLAAGYTVEETEALAAVLENFNIERGNTVCKPYENSATS